MNELSKKFIIKLQAFWYRRSLLAYGLLPFAWIFQSLSRLRYYFYQLKGPTQFAVPIIIVGNITLGGSGKTPLVAWLAKFLQEQGYFPGIVMRGYKGNFRDKVLEVLPNSHAMEVGDEPLLLAQKTQTPVVVGKNRPKAVAYLLEKFPKTNIVICDDGLQHYALARDIEIVIMDGKKRLGNGFCLPAGPLREGKDRLAQCDFIVITDGKQEQHEWKMTTRLSQTAYALTKLDETVSINEWVGKKIHAVAAIGHPDRFFNMLREKGIEIIEHPFPDHYTFCKADFSFEQPYPIVMTEKDAVKCQHFSLKNAWVVPLEVDLQERFQQTLLRRATHGQKTPRDPRLSDL